uniref:RNase H type-1 domain-containing protein n=1 Tax=Hordeum vulgare subsp. vulgare TaxID=112509 RepID=A0A8I6X629_HORVV
MSPVLGHIGLKEIIAAGAWYIWWQRHEHYQAFSSNHSVKLIEKAIETSWSKPPQGSNKLNIDAAFFEDGTGAMGAVIRNDRGEAVAGMAHKFFNVLSPAAAEARALEKGLALVEYLGCSPIIVESDSLELLQLCNGVYEVLT